jgi:ABC-type amino acid transport substrate-binding protein
MSRRPGVEQRIADWFLEEAPDQPPDRVLQAAFDDARKVPQERPRLVRVQFLTKGLSVAAALVLLGSIATFALMSGAWPERDRPTESHDALSRMIETGVLRVAIRPDFPQTISADGVLVGFDPDVAAEVARRLGVRLAVVPVGQQRMFEDPSAWDVALASTPAWSIDPGSFTSTSPYYAWPHLLLVGADSAAQSLDDVQGQPICAVSRDAGSRWLIGAYGPPVTGGGSTQPLAGSLLLRDSDAACLAALEAGEVEAMVTAVLTPAQVAARADLRTIGGPPPEPRVAVVSRAADANRILMSVDAALSAMRDDGTLARLSRARFGSDLSADIP